MEEIKSLMQEFKAPWCKVDEGEKWQIYQAVYSPDGQIINLKKTYKIKKGGD